MTLLYFNAVGKIQDSRRTGKLHSRPRSSRARPENQDSGCKRFTNSGNLAAIVRDELIKIGEQNAWDS